MIKVIEGHLTQTNKKHIQKMFDMGIRDAKMNTISYYITLIKGYHYRVTIVKKERAWVGSDLKNTSYYSEITI